MKFGTIMADPPWPYEGGGPVGNGGRGSQGGAASRIIQVNASKQYGLMSIDDICSLRVSDYTEINAHLYLWTTNSFMEEAYSVARAWGFAPKTILTWVKTRVADGQPSMKTGYYYRSATEHILFCVRGSQRLLGKCEPTAFLEPRDAHSVKPDRFYQLAMEQSPGPYLELFSRRPREGWSVWGNEVESDIKL